MDMNNQFLTLQEYIEKLQKILDQNEHVFLESKESYLNLSHTKEIQPETLNNKTTPPPQPLSEAFTLLLTALEQKNIDRLTLGTNELLKTMLRLLNEDNQKLIAEKFLRKIEQLFYIPLCLVFPTVPITGTFSVHVLNLLESSL